MAIVINSASKAGHEDFNKIELMRHPNIKAALKPFVKWAGGKGQLLSELQGRYPLTLGYDINKYAEPFVGGGAVLFDILSKYEMSGVYISDTNKELISAYTAIRDNVESLISSLDNLREEYIRLDSDARKLYYYEKRALFNQLKEQACNDTIRLSAIFIFLNKTCFNGLYRVNKKGLFNVPMGNYPEPCICDAENLRAISKKIQNVLINCGDYSRSADFIDDETFVYFDPPYRPINSTSSFTSYTAELFNDESQKELADFIALMDRKGAKILLSNSDPKNHSTEDNFFDNLYAGLKIKRVKASRAISSKAYSRGRINELLISNF